MKYAVATTFLLFFLFLIAALNTLIPLLIRSVLP